MTDTNSEPLAVTQMLMKVPGRAPFSQWRNSNPILVAALAANGGVPEQEVVDHLNELFSASANDPEVRPLDQQAATLNRYINEYVAVG
jgi:hypothetical protein